MAAMRAFEHDQYPWKTSLENSFASTLSFEETNRQIRLRISRELVLENKRSLGTLSTSVKQHSTLGKPKFIWDGIGVCRLGFKIEDGRFFTPQKR